MRDSKDPDSSNSFGAPADATTSGGSGRRRRRRRGYVLPLDFEKSIRPDADDSFRRSRRHRRRGRLGGLEIFIGLSALWMVLVVGAIMLEAVSGIHWFFVEHQANPILGHSNWVVGQQVMLADGTMVPVDPSQLGGDSESGAEVVLDWVRVIAVLLTVPCLYIAYRVVRRLRRRSGRASK